MADTVVDKTVREIKQKRKYEKPKLVHYGTLAKITMGSPPLTGSGKATFTDFKGMQSSSPKDAGFGS